MFLQPRKTKYSKTRKGRLKKFKFKKHINLQLGAGVDKLFETLIDDKFINFKFRKRVMDICRDWSKMSDDIGVLQ